MLPRTSSKVYLPGPIDLLYSSGGWLQKNFDAPLWPFNVQWKYLLTQLIR